MLNCGRYIFHTYVYCNNIFKEKLSKNYNSYITFANKLLSICSMTIKDIYVRFALIWYSHLYFRNITFTSTPSILHITYRSLQWCNYYKTICFFYISLKPPAYAVSLKSQTGFRKITLYLIREKKSILKAIIWNKNILKILGSFCMCLWLAKNESGIKPLASLGGWIRKAP